MDNTKFSWRDESSEEEMPEDYYLKSEDLCWDFKSLDEAPAAENKEHQIEEVARNLHAIFVEGCCLLYNDIRNLLDDFVEEQDKNCKCLTEFQKRENILMRQAEELSETVPELACTVQLRLRAVGRAMEQLKIKHEQDDQSTKFLGKEQTIHSQFRKWLQNSEIELEGIKAEILIAKNNLQYLQRLRADQQVLQLQIETEGRALQSSAQQQLLIERKNNFNEKKLERWRRNLEALEHRWCSIWLASLENLELINQYIQQIKKLEDDTPTNDLNISDLSDYEKEPLKKRRRFLSGLTFTRNSSLTSITKLDETDEEDTIPFTKYEYESICKKSPIKFTKMSETNSTLLPNLMAHQRSYSMTNSSADTGFSTSTPSRQLSDDEFKDR